MKSEFVFRGLGGVLGRIYLNWAGRWVVLQRFGRVDVFDNKQAAIIFTDSLDRSN